MLYTATARRQYHSRSKYKMAQSFPFNFARGLRNDKFRVIDNDGNIEEFAAHKFLLAGTSEVYSRQLYGSKKARTLQYNSYRKSIYVYY